MSEAELKEYSLDDCGLFENRILFIARRGEYEMKKRKKSSLLSIMTNIFFVLLLVLGICLIFNNQIQNFLFYLNNNKYNLSELTPQEIQKNAEQEGEFDFTEVELVSLEEVLKAQFDNLDLPVIGSVAVPDVGIKLPIFKGVANKNLILGAGTLNPNQKMGEGNYALASHRSKNETRLFTPLKKVQEDDLIYLTDLQYIYTYRIDLKKIAKPTEVHYIEDSPEKKQVTLVTCGDPEGKTRLIVQGELEDITLIKQATQEQLSAFELN